MAENDEQVETEASDARPGEEVEAHKLTPGDVVAHSLDVSESNEADTDERASEEE